MRVRRQGTWQGPTELARFLVPIGELKHPELNARQGDVAAIGESLQRFGQMRPVLVRAETMEVVAGNHVLKALRALEWSHVSALVVSMTDADAAAYILADNRTHERGGYAMESLAEQLERAARLGNLAGTGYNPADVKTITERVARVRSAARDAAEKTTVREHERVKPGVVVHVGPLSQDDARDFENHVTVLRREWALPTREAAICEALSRAAREALAQ